MFFLKKMNIRHSNRSNLKISQKSLFIFFLFNIVFLIIFCLLYNFFYSLSITIHIFLHNYFNTQFFIQVNILFYKYFNNEYISYITLIFIYNFFNSYKSFILYSILLFSKLFTGLVQLIIITPPLYYDEKITYFYLEKYTFSFPPDILIFVII